MELKLDGISPQEMDELQRNVFMTTLEQIKAWARSSSIYPVTFGLACCAIEMMGVGGANYDLDRFGFIFPDVTTSVGLYDCVWNGDEEDGTNFTKIV